MGCIIKLSPREELKRILRSACSRAIRCEQRDWPRKPEAIARSMRVFAFAERNGAYDGWIKP